MLEDEEYPSSDEQSDEDFKPENEDSDVPSEEDSNDDEREENCESADTKLGKTRKRRRTASSKKSKRAKETATEEDATDALQSENKADDEEDKEKIDAIWADFLGSSSESYNKKPVKSTQSTNDSVNANGTTSTASEATTNESSDDNKKPEKKKITEIFEFAGEKVEVEKEVATEEQQSVVSNNAQKRLNEIPSGVKKPPSLGGFNRGRTGGGLGAVLGQIGKKQKLSTLEKTKLDWSTFKQNQGIDEELQTHNKGRDGYLERQDFLERTDLRQFEIEKTIRQTTRRK